MFARIIVVLGIASALALGVATQVAASPILGIELIEAGYAPFSTTSSTDPLIVVKNFGTFGLNIEINRLVTNPLSIDLGSLNVSTSAAGTLTIIASATGLTTPLGLTTFLSQFGGYFSGQVTSVTLNTYISNSDTMFATNTLLASLTANGASGSPFTTSATGTTTTTDPFAITEVMTIKTAGQAALALDGSIAQASSIAQAPEIDAGSSGTAIALLLGILFLAGEQRSRRTA
jgi:hypothetical protein